MTGDQKSICYFCRPLGKSELANLLTLIKIETFFMNNEFTEIFTSWRVPNSEVINLLSLFYFFIVLNSSLLSQYLMYPLCISLLYTESCPRSEHIDRKTATLGTFLSILLRKNASEFPADSKTPFCVKLSSYLLKKYQ